MQYANVAVNAKTSLSRQTFTYLIPPELLPKIAPGILVLVPFHHRKISAIIVEIVKHGPLSLRGKLKNIIKIIDPIPTLDSGKLELAKWMSDYYLCPIGEVIFSMIPTMAIRQIKKSSQPLLAKRIFSAINNKAKIYALYDLQENRISYYSTLIKKVLKAKKQAIILFSEIKISAKFVDKITKNLESSEIAILHANLTRTQRFNIWNNIRLNKIKVVIGSRSAIFAPCLNLGLIIIDQPQDYAYKEEQAPRYNTLEVAKKISSITGASLIIGSLSPDLESYYLQKKGAIKVVKSHVLNLKNPQIIIVDSKQDRGLISWQLEKTIKESLETKQKIFIYTTKKGMATQVICRDCENTFICPKCQLPYRYYTKPYPQLICHQCSKRISSPFICPVCHGSKFKEYGIGTETLERRIKIKFPDAKIKILDELSAKSNNAEIIIGTKNSLQYLLNDIAVSVVVGIDSILNLPDYSVSESIHSTLVEIIAKTNDQFIIQTHNPENLLWQSLLINKPEIFFNAQLEERKKGGYPPYGKIIKIYIKNSSLEKCQKLAEEVYQKLMQLPKNVKDEIIPPYAGSHQKIRDLFQLQIIIKTIYPQTIKNNLKKISFDKDIHLDVDPISLV
ncbi:MAG: primosomal protein N' [Patescibacteria group bacterium]|nr:primosomal protein N' [Patescibacteria group bacterium]